MLLLSNSIQSNKKCKNVKLKNESKTLNANSHKIESYIHAALLLYFYIHYSPFPKQPEAIRCACMQRTRKTTKMRTQWLLFTSQQAYIIQQHLKRKITFSLTAKCLKTFPFPLDVLCLYCAFTLYLTVMLVAGQEGNKDSWVNK